MMDRTSAESYGWFNSDNSYLYNYDFTPWTLSSDDYILVANVKDTSLIRNTQDCDYFCFICY